jgi:hypothetical protein
MSRRLSWRFLALTAIALAGAGRTEAQARLTGVVRDTTGAPIAGVEVSVQGISRTATTDRDGTFQIGGIPAGTSTVTVRRLGYAPQTTIMRFVDGENRMPDVVLTALPRELDTVTTREQELWRQYPLLREFEDRRKLGLGQFVTRQQLEMQRGGFMTPIFSQMRGVMLVRSTTVSSNAWVATTRTPSTFCTVLEDRQPGERITPMNDANCQYCFPTLFLDRTRLNKLGEAANIGRYHPDMLQAIEVYIGASETPVEYMDSQSGCGVIVLHTRVPEFRARVIANRQDFPTRSRFLINASLSSGTSGATCDGCGSGSAHDFTLGYTLRDRWVISGRYADWSGNHGGPQSITLKQLLLEWYPHPEPARLKWFINAGAGSMSVDLTTSHLPDYVDRYTAGGLPSIMLGTGLDVTVVRRLVLTPFIAYTRSIGGNAAQQRCINSVDSAGAPITDCFTVPSQPNTFSLLQLGTRIGWR